MRGIRLALAGFVLILAGCSSPAEPETLEPLPTQTGTASPSVTPVDPTQPAAPARTPAVDAVQALDSYFQAANRASRGRGIDELQDRFTDTCGLCATQHRNFANAYAVGHTAAGTLYEDWSITVVDETDRQVVLQSVVDTGEIVLSDQSGQVIEEFAGESQISTIWTLARDDSGAWLIIDAQDLA